MDMDELIPRLQYNVENPSSFYFTWNYKAVMQGVDTQNWQISRFAG